MTDIFLKLLNMSISASYLVLAVLLIRAVLPRMPKWINCLLWGIVAFRLLLPFPWESVFSLIPSAEVIPQDITVSETPAIYSGISAVNSAVNPILTVKLLRGELMLDKLLSAAAQIWLIGVAVMLLYSIASYLVLRWRVRASIATEKGIRICDHIDSPFVLGTLFPKIYLPSGMEEENKAYVLAHEKAHIKRLDHWWKPLGFALLTLYWFNPLLWVAYILLCRDIEKACDEKVISQLDNPGKKGYSQALLACSVHRRTIMACPVAFGEVGVKSRIKAVARYKKASFWILLLSVAVCIATAVCFLSDPVACKHSYHSEVAISSTCTQHGLQINTCDQCQHSYGQPAELLPHSYDAGTVTLAATCTEAGIRTLSCTACDAQKACSIEQTGHDLGAPYGITEPDCTHTGEKTATCSQCGEIFVTEILPVNDVHELVERVVRAATCTEEGEGVLECSRCDYSESCSYPLKSHNLEQKVTAEATCLSFETVEVFCTECAYFRVEYGSLGTHQWIDDGGYFEKCKHCGFSRQKTEPVSLLDGVTGSSPTTPTSPVIIWDPNPYMNPGKYPGGPGKIDSGFPVFP